jgi:hypothetical protein
MIYCFNGFNFFWFVSLLSRLRLGWRLVMRLAPQARALTSRVVRDGYHGNTRLGLRLDHVSLFQSLQKARDFCLIPTPTLGHEADRCCELTAPQLDDNVTDPPRARFPRRLHDEPDPRLTFRERLVGKARVVEQAAIDRDIAAPVHRAASLPAIGGAGRGDTERRTLR